MVCLHGFTDTWRTWELVLGALERRHDVLALTLAGHAGGPPLPAGESEEELLDAIERSMDEAGFETAHLVGNSLGGYLALQLAARGRARTVVALAPAGGWMAEDDSHLEMLGYFTEMKELLRAVAPQAESLLALPEGRRRATLTRTVRYEHIPDELLAHQMRGVAACDGAEALVGSARRGGWQLDAAAVGCPVRVIWGTEDRLLPWPAAAARYRAELPQADWVVLEGVGHCPQLDVPLETAQLILGLSAP
jgi:pimeloyl-ACP methyl ester carboxylesterase